MSQIFLYCLGMKQRLMTHLYRYYKCTERMNEFFYFFGQLRTLRMMEMQLVGDDMVLIRFVNLG